jgi:hypothetical protein
MKIEAFDNTPQQAEKYQERSLQIATEMLYVFFPNKIRIMASKRLNFLDSYLTLCFLAMAMGVSIGYFIPSAVVSSTPFLAEPPMFPCNWINIMMYPPLTKIDFRKYL